ncbi:MAG: hypothetical protein QOI53_2435 [Verrucomicrobiota bacterium]|nr:hypothetical protein [Verrucomicrobiota bacterium]
MAPVKRDTISRFNRDTVWLATGLLGTVVFAALVLAVQECQPKAPQTERDLSLNANPAGAGSVLASSSSTGKMTPEQGSGDDHTFTETALLETPSSHAAPTPAHPLAPEMNPNAPRQGSAPERRPRSRSARNWSSLASRAIDVKRRLIELWHESLARNAKSRSWTAFSNLSKGASKKAAYTAETSH